MLVNNNTPTADLFLVEGHTLARLVIASATHAAAGF